MPKTKMKKRTQYEDRLSPLPASFEPAPSGRSVRRKHQPSAQHAALAPSTSQAQKNSNRSKKTNNNNSNAATSSAVPSTHPTNHPTFVQPHVLTNSQKTYLNQVVESLNLSSESHKQVLKICEDTRPENQFIGTIGFLSYIQQTVESGLANRPLALQSTAVNSWKPSDVLKKYIKSKDTEFIAAQYPPGYGTPDGSAATKAVNDWANRLATDTRSRLRNTLLTNVKPSGKTKPTHPMPSLKRLVHHTFILQTDPRTEDQLFEHVSKDFKHRLAFLRLHAVHTYQIPSTDHKYCVWNSVDDTLEFLKIQKAEHGKLYKEA
ncbi:uncharacterized protein MELLADRAFT_116746 [Melampsora larici-populina 98AG31]|uniref:Uncharacterized protein n=1 Tax=Melampsora larici-populina (strain 98AG31 / pathotype 3-4-7) TaxID=747676 RepID=F4RPI3_MELLP|nr:uncharacterized protein MELLADRAFT_116746 [Melampsora larici-populina 98AG31]EGG05534.1 hypothetical protein MELLADRAFT_116746 [Melampsora larici-populina 98AG31]